MVVYQCGTYYIYFDIGLILVLCVPQLTPIFYIVMDETTQFISHMFHKPWFISTKKTIFNCNVY